MRLKAEIICITLFCFQQLSAQQHEEGQMPAELEALTVIPDQELDLSELSQRQHINLNTATASELSTLHMLNQTAIAALLQHIRLYGPLQSVYEMQTIEGFDIDLIKSLIPYTTIETPLKLRFMQAKARHQLMLRSAFRSENSPEYDKTNPDAYMGSPVKWGLRYQANVDEYLSFGLLCEKDAGESHKTRYISACLGVANMGRLKRALLGDQQIHFGQGLLIGSGLRTGKSSMVMQILKTRNGAKPHTSFNESGYISGISTNLSVNRLLDLNIFAGQRRLDARTDTDSNGLSSYFGLSGSGYYRTAAELARRHTLSQNLCGATLHFRSRSLELGAGAVCSQTRLSTARGVPSLAAANTIGKGAIDWKWQTGNLLWFGETVFSDKQLPSLVTGCLIAAGRHSDVSILLRRYDTGYISDLSNAFGESGKNRDETGLFCGMQMHLPWKLQLNLYNDLSRFKQFRYRVNAASFVSEQFAELQYRDKRPIQIKLQYRQISSQVNQSGTFHMKPLQAHIKQTVRLQIEYRSGPFRLRNRFEQTFYRVQNNGLKTGMLMYQDMECKISGRIRLNARLSVFDAEDHLSRSFAFENDLPGTYSISAYSGKGMRYYLLMQIQMTKDLKIWFRFARSSFETAQDKVLSPGADSGSQQTDLNMQVQWKL